MKAFRYLLLASVFLSGCAATHTLPPTELRYGESYLPPIHVMSNDPLKGGEIRNSLRATGMFEDVLAGQAPADAYAVRVQVAQERDHAAFPLVLLSAATLFLLPLFGLSVMNQPPVSWGGMSVWLSLLGLGLVCTAFAYILYFRLLTSIGPVKSMTVTFMIPPFGVLWGALFLGEPLSMAHLYGGLLIAVALWLVLKPGAMAASK